ncbi:MAG: mechanosensitive ion channel family protein [Chloroflexi bacterium]|nr:mechanosensitive ion channel family protein [Chloroflexota bacterium]
MDELDWDWFKSDGVWILVTVVVTAVLLWAMRHWIPRWITSFVIKITPKGQDWSRGARVIRRTVFWIGSIIILAVAVLLVLGFAGVDIGRITDELKDVGDAIVDWLRGSGIRVAIIIAVAVLLQQIVRSLIPHAVHGQVVKKEKKKRFIEEAEQRAETLSSFLVGVAVTVIWVVVIFMVLPEFRINIGPLLAGAGVMGLAIGFGAQGLIRDILSGLFIILEDQYAKGDWVQLGSVDGEVEYLGLRRTILRDFDGVHHTVPNGEIKIASNYSKNWACINMDISVGYGEDLDRVAEVINQVCEEMSAESQWKKSIIQVPRVLRVQNFGDSGIDMKVWGTTKPMMQWGATGEIRRRLKRRFDEEGIEIPWPHMKLYFGEASDERSSVKPEKPHFPKKQKRKSDDVDPMDVKGSGAIDGGGGGDGGI